MGSHALLHTVLGKVREIVEGEGWHYAIAARSAATGHIHTARDFSVPSMNSKDGIKIACVQYETNKPLLNPSVLLRT